ncbi:MAG: M18 family aminopeptidase [Chlamydiia bacterium]|nr:M18 family aminopeptidase [Chlamydiia bacterium]
MTLDSFMQFLDRSSSPFHAAHEIISTLRKTGFTALKEGAQWSLEPGKGYFLCRGDALVAAFRLPQRSFEQTLLLASHVDSPCLKLKPHPEVVNRSIGQWNTEIYGAPLLHSWLDRDLIVSGRISIINEQGKIASHLVSLPECPVIIPQLALHLNRTIDDKGFFVHKQDHLKPIFSLSAKEKTLEQLLRKKHPFRTLLSFDLFLTPLQGAAFLGHEKECIASPRLDNLTSAFASLSALCSSSPNHHTLQCALFWDHEEIGSTSYLGADSLFVDQILERISSHFKMNREDYYRMKSRSLCLSGDLAHGFHPSFAEKYDPENASLLGHGVVIKFNANQKYATSSATAAPILALAAAHKIPIQSSASRSDLLSGSTVGPIMAAQTGIATLDLGIAGWAMHSARETIAAKDEMALLQLFKAALEMPLSSEES